MSFVLMAPRGTRVTDLATVVGKQPAEIEKLRNGGTIPLNQKKRATFSELFLEWNGRPPEDHEWPAPIRFGAAGNYEWTLPEDTLLASLVGRFDVPAIAKVLTTRLRSVTGDENASRRNVSVQTRMNRLGLFASDVLGGLTVPQAGREYGSVNVIRDAIARGELEPKRIGRYLVIPHNQWNLWKAGRKLPPPDYVQLSTLKKPLGISSDKLPEFAKLGYVPGAIFCHPNGGEHSGLRGSWYIPKEVAATLTADRRAGRAMPWHGKPLMGNLRATWKRWQARRHPTSCKSCEDLWGKEGAPEQFEDFAARYPALAFGAKRHLTRVWDSGLTISEVASQSERSVNHVALAIKNGQLEASHQGGQLRVTKTDATRWIGAGCPSGTRSNDWMAVSTAVKRFGFNETELRAMIDSGSLQTRRAPAGPKRNTLQLPWRQLASLREKHGFTEAQAAFKVGVSIGEFRRLAEGVNWRGQSGIPNVTVDAIIKRLKTKTGHTIKEVAVALGRSNTWVKARIDDGTVVLYSKPWSDRTYITDRDLQILRRVSAEKNVTHSRTPDWIIGLKAAQLAGVTTTTLLRWAKTKQIKSRRTPAGRKYDGESVKKRARLYWQTEVRSTRDTRPDWLKQEQPFFEKGPLKGTNSG